MLWMLSVAWIMLGAYLFWESKSIAAKGAARNAALRDVVYLRRYRQASRYVPSEPSSTEYLVLLWLGRVIAVVFVLIGVGGLAELIGRA